MKKYLIIAFLLVPSLAFGANFYCDCSVSGGTGGAGTYADPFESVADIEAYEVATGFADGDDIYFLEGSTCTMTSDLDINWEGVDGDNYSIFGCYDGDGDFDCDGTRPILQLSGGYGVFSAAIDVSYMRWEYLSLRDTSGSWQNSGSIGISLNSGGDGNGLEGYLVVTDCSFYHFGHYCIEFYKVGDWIVITDNVADTQNGNGFYVIDEAADGPSYGYAAGNTCDELIGYNSTDGHCVALQGTSYWIVEDNISVDAYNGAYVLGTYGPSGAKYNVFRDNKSDGNRQHCIGFIDGDSNSYGNLVYGNICKEPADETSDRPCIRFDNYNGSNGNYGFNNTCYDCGYGGLGIRSTSGNTVDYITYLNNIIVVDGVVTGENEFVWVEEAGTNGSNFTIDYNLWWTVPNTDPSGYTLWDTPDDDTAMTWANWRIDAWGGADNDLADNPDFIDTTDFELTSGSPAIDAGGWLTHVTSTSGSGTTVNVDNTYILHSDFGLLDEDDNAVEGMLVSFYDTTNGRQDREITDITYGTSIVVDSSVTWIYDSENPNDPDYTTQIALRFYGTQPDIGAVEYEETLLPQKGIRIE